MSLRKTKFGIKTKYLCSRTTDLGGMRHNFFVCVQLLSLVEPIILRSNKTYEI